MINTDAFWIIFTASLIGISCALLGCFLVLRKMSMLGDAVSHAVLPGIIIAFLVSGSIAKFPMLIGAALFGMLCTFLIEFFNKKAKLQMDASIGLTFTFLFAIGVILVSAYTGNAHIDEECVLYGEIAFLPLDLWITNSGLNLGPENTWLSGIALLVILGFINFGYKGFQLAAFDNGFAQANGINTSAWHYLLMALVSLVTVVSFESVGAILVVAFLVVPAATAFLVVKQLKQMLVLSSLLSISASILGYLLANLINGSIAAAIVVVMGIQLILAFVLSKLTEIKSAKVLLV